MSLWLIRFFSPVDVFGFGISLIPSANSVDRFVSLFALFLLILHGIRNTIGCKSETKKYTKIEWLGWLEKNGENKKERYNKRNLRSGYFSGLEKLGKEYVDIGVEDFSKGNKFRYLDVHTVGFQLGISAFGHRNLHRRFFPGMCVDGRLKYFSANVRRNWHWTAIRYALHRESKGTGCLCHWHISCVQ